MKKIIMFVVILLAMTITGCNNAEDDNVTGTGNNATNENNNGNILDDNQTNSDQNSTNNDQTNTNQDDKNENRVNQAVDVSFNFTHFELDVDYSEDRDFDVEYENEQDGIEAEIEDDLNNSHLKGDEAFEVLRPIFEQLKFDQNTADDEVISEVISAFEIDDNYEKFELEVTFSDGTTKE